MKPDQIEIVFIAAMERNLDNVKSGVSFRFTERELAFWDEFPGEGLQLNHGKENWVEKKVCSFQTFAFYRLRASQGQPK